MRSAVVLGLVSSVSLLACGSDDPPVERPRVFGGDRGVELQVPRDFNESDSYPLVVLLHGHGASGLLQTAYLQFADVTADPGVFFIAPEGLTGSDGKQFWNSGGACCDFDNTDVDDVGYIGGLIDDISATWPVDPGRVYVVGHSNGSFMAFRMACDRADVIAGIAGLAGADDTNDGAPCAPSQPVSVLHMHGTADGTVPYEGASIGGNAYPGAVTSVEDWQAHDGCAATRTAGPARDIDMDVDGAETAVETADGCPDGVGVELWSLAGSGHVPSVGPDFGATVIAWLEAHARN